MNGEKTLTNLLKNMKPVVHPGDFVFCCVKNLENIDLKQLICTFYEEEAITLIISQSYADRIGLHYPFVASWITLKIHSSLEAVGFTAAFSKALSDEGISCNVVAAYYHDHIFTHKADSARAIEILERLGINES